MIPPFFKFHTYVILLYAYISLGYLHNHIAANYDKITLVNFLQIWNDMCMGKTYLNYWQGFESAVKLNCCHRLISLISYLPFLAFFSKYESSELKPYVVRRNKLNSRYSSESHSSRVGSTKTATLEEIYFGRKTEFLA